MMTELEVVTTADRHDLDDESREAFRQNWPEFIFHDPVAAQHVGWGVPLSWDGTVPDCPTAAMTELLWRR